MVLVVLRAVGGKDLGAPDVVFALAALRAMKTSVIGVAEGIRNKATSATQWFLGSENMILFWILRRFFAKGFEGK